ncbi:acetyltransferase-like isoleucine patch superfamily enzyme [Marmoricola sp. URHA0025 HA25]
MRDLLTTLAFLLPFRRLKIKLLNLVGHDIHPSANVGICLVRHVNRFELAENATIGNFNILGNLDLVRLGPDAMIAYFNLIMCGVTLAPGGEAPEHYRRLTMGAGSRIISFHMLDCSGGLLIAEDCWITGVRTTVLSHAFDPHEGGVIVEPVELKKGAVIATKCTLLAGVVVGEGALLAAGSTAWTRQELVGGNLYGGVPARRLAPIALTISE